jgi:hypothetical protein
MKQQLKTRRRSLLLAVVAVLALTAGAIAYWTTSGAGTGTAATGTSTAVTITQTGVATGMYPGGPFKDLEFTIDNPGPSKQYVSTVTASISSVSAGCAADDFELTQATTPINEDLAVGPNAFAGAKAPKIRMINKATNQDGCKNATVNLSYAAS